MARSWPAVEEDAQERAQDAFCTVLKADKPAERLLGSKRPCRITPELSAGGDVEMVVCWSERSPSPPSPSSSSSSLLLSLVQPSASSGR